MDDFGFGTCSECGGALYEHEENICAGCRHDLEEE